MVSIPLIIDCNLNENDLHALIQLRRSLHVQLFSIPLFHPRLPDSLPCNQDPATRSDRILNNHRDWSENFAGKLTKWIDLDSENMIQRDISVQRFEEELSYALHLGIRSLILPPIKNLHPTNYAHTLLTSLSSNPLQTSSLQRLLVPLPFISSLRGETSNEDEDNFESWRIWIELQQQLNHLPAIELLMEISDEFIEFADRHFTPSLYTSSLSTALPSPYLPPSSINPNQLQSFLDKWVIQPIRFISLPISAFIFNAHGFPVLTKSLQYVVQFFMKYSIGILLTGKPLPTQISTKPPGISNEHVKEAPEELSSAQDRYLPYVQYLRFLQKKTEEELLSDHEKSSSSYFDVLQLPLQPLMDNLESYTYEVFEKDPVKYNYYEKAIGKALTKLQSEVGVDTVLQIMVVGAGRGPLVSASIAAAHDLSIPVKILVIEKNPNAIITLRNRALTECWDVNQVTIIADDMRNHRSIESQKYHLIVSELLGSFGCNELSPECLYATESNLHPSAISIPSCYTSYLQPISSPLLFMSARAIFANPFTSHASSSLALANTPFLSLKGLETPFVVLLKRFYPLAPPLPCWDFRHPKNPQIRGKSLSKR